MDALSAPSADTPRRLLRRRIITGNAIGYAGMLAAIVIYSRDAATHPLLYGLAGAAVGLGTGLAYLSLWKLRQLEHSVRRETASEIEQRSAGGLGSLNRKTRTSDS